MRRGVLTRRREVEVLPHLTEDMRCSDCWWTPGVREPSSPSDWELLRYEWSVHLGQHAMGVIRPAEPLPPEGLVVRSAEEHLRECGRNNEIVPW